jgi:hypothetical protein
MDRKKSEGSQYTCWGSLCKCICHGKSTVPSACIFVDLHAAANNIQLFIFAIEIEKWVHFALS